jgi:hypothetical protein
VPLGSFCLVDHDTFLIEDRVRVHFTGIVFRPPILRGNSPSFPATTLNHGSSPCCGYAYGIEE